jgi:hypothetical protein
MSYGDTDHLLEEGEIPETPMVFHLYHEFPSIYDINIPDPNPDSQDFYGAEGMIIDSTFTKNHALTLSTLCTPPPI